MSWTAPTPTVRCCPASSTRDRMRATPCSVGRTEVSWSAPVATTKAPRESPWSWSSMFPPGGHPMAQASNRSVAAEQDPGALGGVQQLGHVAPPRRRTPRRWPGGRPVGGGGSRCVRRPRPRPPRKGGRDGNGPSNCRGRGGVRGPRGHCTTLKTTYQVVFIGSGPAGSRSTRGRRPDRSTGRGRPACAVAPWPVPGDSGQGGAREPGPGGTMAGCPAGRRDPRQEARVARTNGTSGGSMGAQRNFSRMMSAFPRVPATGAAAGAGVALAERPAASRRPVRPPAAPGAVPR